MNPSLSTTQPNPQWLRARAAAARLGISRSWFHALVARGDLPRPRKLGTRVSVWRADEVDAAMERLLAAADREVAA